MQDSQWQPTEVTKVVIIGGGIAGLAAAKTLESEDCEDYILLEGDCSFNKHRVRSSL